MAVVREVSKVWGAKPTLEGAGVRLMRAFGPREAELTDPFLLLDDFHSANPEDYLAGFPWHPHRGIETVTYMIAGSVRHGDSMGNKGVIKSGDVQWMTAGGGILHNEMPEEHKGMMQGFQLWVNLPKKHKMMPPRYRDVKAAQIPETAPAKGVKVKVMAGSENGVTGPVKDLVVDAEYLGVALEPGAEYERKTGPGRTALAYVWSGNGIFGSKGRTVGERQAALLSEGDTLKVKAQRSGMRFLLVAGTPLDEPIAWGGPIVMNTEGELDEAFRELENGSFIKGGAKL
jgi:quercetin 2,3-dioxygenase